MGAPKKTATEEEKEDWLVTYADAVTLLMAFFVLLVSVSKVDLEMFDRVTSGIQEEISKKIPKSALDALKTDLSDVVYSMQADQAVQVAKDAAGIVMEFASGAFFRAGTADLTEAAIPLLGRVAQAINAPLYQTFGVEVEGHTDNDPIQTLRYPSNWELSTSRATSVIRFFLTQNIEPVRMRAIGFADTQPKFPNDTPEGVPIPENKVENRRVVIRISPRIKKYQTPNIPRRSLVDMPMTGTTSQTKGPAKATKK